MYFRIVAVALLASTSALSAEPFMSSASSDATGWTGGYGGIVFGAVRSFGAANRGDYAGDLLTLDVSNGLFPDEKNGSETSAIGGVTLGYGFRRGSFVAGVEVDFSFTSSDVDNGFSRIDPNPNPPFTGVNTITGYRTELDNLATARLRAGYAAGDTLLYATGGLAAGRVTNRFTLEIPELAYTSPDWSSSGTRFGYVIGAGIEHRMTSRLSVKLEVLSYDLEDTTVDAADPVSFPGQSIAYSFDNDGTVGRIGLNFSF